MQKTLVMLALAGLCVGCGPASISGNFDGVALTASDAVATVSTTGGISSATVAISSVPGLCSETLSFSAGATFLTISLANSDGAVDAGEYEVRSPADLAGASGRIAFVVIGRSGDTCEDAGSNGSASGGTVSVTSVETADGGGVAGTFSMTIEGEDVTGSFDAPLCDDLAQFEACE